MQAPLLVRPLTDAERQALEAGLRSPAAVALRRCRIVLDGKIRLVTPRPYRAFQGWRYLPAADAPADLERSARGAAIMPEQMRRELSELGLL